MCFKSTDEISKIYSLQEEFDKDDYGIFVLTVEKYCLKNNINVKLISFISGGKIWELI